MIYKLLLMSVYLFASGDVKTSHDSAQKVLENMTLTYSQVEYMKSDFTKVSKSMLLGTEEKVKGKLEYSKGKFRMEMLGQKGSVFIKGEESFWHINGKEVMTGSSKKAVPSIFEAIFSDVSIWGKLKTSYVSVPSKVAVIKVDPKGKVPNVSEMVLEINLEKRTLTKLNYIDDVNNSVDITFKKIRFFSKSKPKRFKYDVKKGDSVTQM